MTESSEPSVTKTPDALPASSPWWRKPGVWIAVLCVLALGFVLGRATFSPAPPPPNPAQVEHEHAQTWTCSMHPQVQSPTPGDCPMCGMDLIPMRAGQGADLAPNQVHLTPRARALAAIQTTEVRTQKNSADESVGGMELVGRVVRDEDKVRTVTSWIGGRVDRLFVRTTGERVRKGQRLASLYSPQVYVAHKELLVAARQLKQLKGAEPFAQRAAQAQLEAAHQKLKLLGLSNAELKRMKASATPWTTVSIRSSASGTVMQRRVSQGQVIAQGATLFEVVDLKQVWVELDAYESMLPSLRVGQKVDVVIDSLANQVHQGVVSFIDPVVDTATQVARVRIEVPNLERALKPGMVARARLNAPSSAGAAAPLVIPHTAPLYAGARSLVYVEVSDDAKGPVYEARDVDLGARMGAFYVVRGGLSSGERVVTHGAFVLDSDLQIRGQLSLMSRPDDTTAVRAKPVDLSDDAAKALRPVLEGYLDVQEHLVADDLAASQARATTWLAAIQSISLKSSLSKDVYAPLSVGLKRDIGALLKAKDISEARDAFSSITRVLDVFLVRFGNVLNAPVRKAYCPMARGNKGDYWYQRGEQVKNVYFGKSMLACGEIRKQIDPSTTLMQDAPTTQGGAHVH